MFTKKIILGLMIVGSCALLLSSCGDDSVKPKTNPNDAYSSIRIIRDYQYLDYTYFDLTRKDSVLSQADLQPGDTITLLQLYYFVSGFSVDGMHPCRLYVDPLNQDKYPDETVQGNFALYDNILRPGAHFILDRTHFYIIMDTPVPPGVALGVYMEYRHPNGDGTFSKVTVGDVSSNPHQSVLKTILTLNPQPNFVTWNYVWRNIYSFGGPIESLTKLVVKIYRGNATSSVDMDRSDPDHLPSGQTFINAFGLDHDNNGQIDIYNDQILDAVQGYLKFPFSRPFAEPSILPESLQVRHNYDDNNLTNRQGTPNTISSSAL